MVDSISFKEVLPRLFTEAKAKVVLKALSRLLDEAKSKASLDLPKIEEAALLLLEVQKDSPDRFPSGVPYVVHPIEVALHVMELQGTPSTEQIIAALLHDCVEDEPVALIEALRNVGEESSDDGISSNLERAYFLLGRTFGDTVAATVRSVTNPDFDRSVRELIAAGDVRNEEELKNELYVEHVVHILYSKTDASVVKISDFWQNAFCLQGVRDQNRLRHWKAKYGGVVKALPALLNSLSEDHPLYNSRIRILEEVNRQWDFFFAS